MIEQNVTKTEYGNITVTRHAIGLLVSKKVKEFNGKVLLSNHKGKIMGIVSKLGRVDEIDNMDITFDENGAPDIKIFVIIRFGTSIAKTTNTLIENIHSSVTTVLGQEPAGISVVVAGMISKNIAKRNIEVSKRYDDR